MCVCFFCFHFSVCLTIWFKFWVIIFAMYLPSIATVTQHTGCNFLLALIYSKKQLEDSRFKCFLIGPGLISLLYLDPFARINVYVDLVMLNFICFCYCCNKHNLNSNLKFEFVSSSVYIVLSGPRMAMSGRSKTNTFDNGVYSTPSKSTKTVRFGNIIIMRTWFIFKTNNTHLNITEEKIKCH